MTFRARMSVAFMIAALGPLAVLAHGVRREVTQRLTAQHERRVNTLVDIVRQDLGRESASIAARLEILETDLSTDDRFRLGAVRGDVAHRRYVLDWAERAMEIAGLSMLRVYDASGRVVSSGHFRNEFGRDDGRLLSHLAAAPGGQALVRVKLPSASFLALTRTESVTVGGLGFTLVGGTTVDSTFFTRLSRDGELDVSLALGEVTVPASHAVERLPLVYVDDSSSDLATTQLTIAPRGGELETLRRDLDRWVAGSFVLAAIAGVILVAWLAAGLSRPMATLARAALSIDFTTPEMDTVAARDDEVGTLARRFAAMTRRLRAGAVRLRDAERRATVGEMARQVNHDMKNGLVPIRNVVRHLSQVQQSSPHELATVFAERRGTLESSVTYLDELATRWARLTPRGDRLAVDVNSIIQDVVTATRDAYATPIHVQLQPDLAPVLGDPLALRRVFDNVVTNALQSLTSDGGSVTISSESRDRAVRVTVTDTGSGMTPEQVDRALRGFYTTKPQGTGLGLSVVRRLVADHGGEVHIETTPRRGTAVFVELPAHSAPTHRSKAMHS